MKVKRKYIKTALLSCALASFSLFMSPISWAQSDIISDAGTQTAIELGQLIKNEVLLTTKITSIDEIYLNSLAPKDQLRHLRQHALGTITLGNKLNPNDILALYEAAVERSGTQRD